MRALNRVPWRLLLIAVVLFCWLLAELFGLGDVSETSIYLYLTSLLLAVGLYGSTCGIDLGEAREHKGIILAAVTVGVVLKAVLIGAACYLATSDPLYLLLGVAVAQIDPLSVAAIMGDSRMSPRAKTILASWASFDDPLTVILVVYAVAFASGSFGLTTAAGVATSGGIGSGVAAYGLTLLYNLLWAGAAVLIWRSLRERAPKLAAWLLLPLAAVAVGFFLMLGVALAGLFIRPDGLVRGAAKATQAALFLSAGLLGVLLVNGLNLTGGLLLGAAAFAAQVLVGFLLTRGLPRVDRVHLALAQQNGITAIILGLRLEADYDGVVAVIAPAILVTNTIHFVVNRMADRGKPPVPAGYE